jgi:hypothetical protein
MIGSRDGVASMVESEKSNDRDGWMKRISRNGPSKLNFLRTNHIFTPQSTARTLRLRVTKYYKFCIYSYDLNPPNLYVSRPNRYEQYQIIASEITSFRFSRYMLNYMFSQIRCILSTICTDNKSDAYWVLLTCSASRRIIEVVMFLMPGPKITYAENDKKDAESLSHRVSTPKARHLSGWKWRYASGARGARQFSLISFRLKWKTPWHRGFRAQEGWRGHLQAVS